MCRYAFVTSSDASNCVEGATTATAIHIRDSKRPTAPHLTVTPATWTDFLSHAAVATSAT
ncbi:DUF397 domain-containing protein [Streptomyces sp. NPDC047028]|uniref:DUF397 domain-containing protein n=1 Tax=Streptomyces sp. NPDC047028 TaxID=3155793 RepID=UPI00340E886B